MQCDIKIMLFSVLSCFIFACRNMPPVFCVQFSIGYGCTFRGSCTSIILNLRIGQENDTWIAENCSFMNKFSKIGRHVIDVVVANL